MKNTLLYFCLIFIVSCEKEAPRTLIASNSVQNYQNPLNYFDTVKTNSTKPYSLKINLEKQQNDIYSLSISMELDNGAYFVSPNAKRDFKGKFTVYINETTYFNKIGKLIEIPLSEEEYDKHPFVNGTVNWVRENTVYHQKIRRTNTKAFQVKGYIQFTIEPQCTLEKIPFILKQENGKMAIDLINC